MSEEWKRISGSKVIGRDKNGDLYSRPATKHEIRYLRQHDTGRSRASEDEDRRREIRTY